jgi:hypothetical protein
VSDEWVVRKAVAEDEDCVVATWLRSLCYSRAAVDLGFPEARRSYSDDQVAFWSLNHPIVTAVARTADVTVLCDPERAHHAPGQPAIILGASIVAGNTVYGAWVKNKLLKSGFGGEIMDALLGDRLDRPQVMVMELVDLLRLKAVPEEWVIDASWWHAMRKLATLAIDRDPVAGGVVAHMMDPAREQWLPRSMRAA